MTRRSQILICETADSASARGRPSAPGMIQPAGNPEKDQRDVRPGVPLSRTRERRGFDSLHVRHPAIEKPNAVERLNGGVQVHQYSPLDNDV